MLSTSTVCGGRKYFVDMTIKTFCRLIELFSPSPSTATRNQHNPHTAVEQKPALSWHCLWNEVLESAPTCEGRDFCPGCGWDLVGGLRSAVPPTNTWPDLLSQRNQSFWDCLVVTILLMVVWAKIISLLLLKDSAPLFWSPVLSIILQPYPYFCLLLACGLHLPFRLWTHKWWNWLLAQVQMEMWEWWRAMSHISDTAKRDSFSIQDKSHLGNSCCWQQLPPSWWWWMLSPWCHLPCWPCDISREREWGERPD